MNQPVKPWNDQTHIAPEPASSKLSEFTFIPQDNDRGDKQERDLAFAVAAIEAGHLTRKQLAQAVRDWTIHGDSTLPTHLVEKGLLDGETRSKLEDVAETRLQRALENVSSNGTSSSLSLNESLIKQLDEFGKVASVLGLSVSSIADQEHLTRSFPASYHLMRKIGQGGLGVVWLARDENLKRIVAIKEIIRHGGIDSPEVRRFRREAEVTGRLEHPSIVPLYQYGFDETTEQPFYAMRYIGKRTLENAIDEYHERRRTGEHDPLQLHYLLTSFVAVCQAIAYAHSKNVVHRDLKPENVALDSYGQVIVLDWGLAKLTGELELIESCEASLEGEVSAMHQTQDGQVLGTPMFMAPEQAAGRLDEIDERTDVYGLGAILYSILTGYAPHEKSRESMSSNTSMSELLRAIVSQPIMKARLLNPEIAPELEAICAKALAIKPYSRYSTALELAEDVQRWSAGEPVSAYAEPWTCRTARWIGNHRILSGLAAAILTISLVSGISFGLATRNAAIAQREAQFTNLAGEARSLSMKMESRAEELSKNVRFMSMVPPITGIVNARGGILNAADDTEEIWKVRLEQIFTGLLGAHPNYLSVTFLSSETKEETLFAKEIVRVERSRAEGSLIRSVPTSRLVGLADDPALKKISALSPEEVYLEEQSLDLKSSSEDESIVLGGIPIYNNATGELFGAVVLEADLETGLRDLLTGAIQTADQAYIVNSDHRVLLHYTRDQGLQSATRGQGCDCLPLSVQKYLSDPTPANEFTDGQSIVARTIRLNRSRDSDWICLVLVLE